MMIFKRASLSTKDLAAFYIFRCNLFSISIHFLNAAGAVLDPHDHPRSFISIVLKGWYIETRNRKWRKVMWFNVIRASAADFHRIAEVSKGGCITLALEGPKVREWGFHTINGWVPWKLYLAKNK